MQEATQKYRKLTDYWTKCCYLSLPFSLLTATYGSFAFLNCRAFSVLGHSTSQILNVTSDLLCHIYIYIVLFPSLKMAFSKLCLAKYHCLHKKTMFTGTSIYWFHVFNYYKMSLQVFFFYKFFCTNLSQAELRWCYTKRFIYYIRFVWLLFSFKISSYKSEVIEPLNFLKIVLYKF